MVFYYANLHFKLCFILEYKAPMKILFITIGPFIPKVVVFKLKMTYLWPRQKMVFLTQGPCPVFREDGRPMLRHGWR